MSCYPDLKAEPHCCEEASLRSHNYYIPCNVPATKLVFHVRDDRTYRMCAACAWHNINNRGGEDKGEYHDAI